MSEYPDRHSLRRARKHIAALIMEVEQLKVERDQARAEAAQLRDALVAAQGRMVHRRGLEANDEAVFEQVRAALSTSSGKEALEAVRMAREALKVAWDHVDTLGCKISLDGFGAIYEAVAALEKAFLGLAR